MFTGIVQATGQVVTVTPSSVGRYLTIDRSAWQPVGGYMPARGDSICISGVCLTITELDQATLSFDVVPETLDKTTLGQLTRSALVNLEPAVLANQPLSGHFMQGHVDGVGQIVGRDEDTPRLCICPPAELMDWIIPKGSIAVDGVSLTIAKVGPESFEIALIPTTLGLTTLAQARVGDRVNLECDILAKTIVHALRQQQHSDVSIELLREAGFIDD